VNGAIVSKVQAQCATPTWSVSSSGQEYYFCNTAATWPTADTNCKNLDGVANGWFLTTINDATEDTYVNSLNTNPLWIGYNDQTLEGTFAWTSGSSASYANWNGGEPNDSAGEDCTEQQNGAGWNDLNCTTTTRRYVCEGPSICGNGVIGAGETCDDSDTDSGDGCSSACQIEAGYNCTGTPSTCTQVCAGGTWSVSTANQEYFFCNTAVTWTAADTACKNVDGAATGWFLTTINDSSEDTYVNSITNQALWLGYNDITLEGTFAWTSGLSPGYTNWNAGQPDNTGNSDCTEQQNGSGWTDITCASSRRYICEGPSICGNGVIGSGEACDDGNAVSSDGCSATCSIEAGWSCTGTPSTCTQACSGGTWSVSSGQEYFFCNTAVNWNNADTACKNVDGAATGWFLTTINDATEDTYINSLSANPLWIGYNDATTEGTFVWTSGLSPGYTNWTAGQPDNTGNSDCVEQQNAAGWTDLSCTGNTRRYVCEGPALCGNGVLGSTESCDDANTTPGDGCSATCTLETGWSCSGTPSVCSQYCAAGVWTVSSGREYYRCTSNADWVSADTNCKNIDGVANNWFLATISDSTEDAYINSLSATNMWIGYNDRTAEGTFVWTSGLSPGYTNWNGGEPNNLGNEDCAEQQNGAGWNDLVCTTGEPYICEGSVALCGNGVVGTGETCDDSDAHAGDGCSATCVVEPGWSCTGTPSVCTQACSSGSWALSSTSREYFLCNGAVPWASADTNCKALDGTASGWFLTTIDDTTENTFVNSLSTNNLWIGYNDITTEGTFAWAGGTSTFTGWNAGQPDNSGNSDCVEQQNASGWNDLTCASALRYVCEGPAICGNGIQGLGEGCDDGNTNAGDGCSNHCIVETGWSCTGTSPSVCTQVCADGGSWSVSSGQEYYFCNSVVSWSSADTICKNIDGVATGWFLTTVNNGTENTYIDGLTTNPLWIGLNDVTAEGTYVWTSGISSAHTNWAGGQPDDSGNADCIEMQNGGTWTDLVCASSTRRFVCEGPAVCGNGVVGTGEGCDDGGTISGDGCASACTVEAGWTCTGSPSTCVQNCSSGTWSARLASMTFYPTTEYFYCPTLTTWTAAESVCQNLDGSATGWHLATVNDLNDNTYIDGLAAADLWIGYNDVTTEGAFVWAGATSSYTRWGGGEPNNSGNEDCAQLLNASGLWNDIICTTTLAFVCEGPPICGNGVVAHSEQCDVGDVDNNDGDGCQSNCGVEDGYRCNVPTSAPGGPSVCFGPGHASVAKVTRYFEAGRWLLEWETSSEEGTLGFVVSHFDTSRSEWIAVHDGMLMALHGAAQGGLYRVVDSRGAGTNRDRYRIEEVDVQGMHAVIAEGEVPVQSALTSQTFVMQKGLDFSAQARPSSAIDNVIMAAATSRALTKLETAGGVLQDARVKLGTPKALDTAQLGRAQLKPVPIIRGEFAPHKAPRAAVLTVNEDRLYTLSLSTIADALSVSRETVREAIANHRLTISEQQAPVVWKHDAEQIVFYGGRPQSVYSAYTPLWLSLHGDRDATRTPEHAASQDADAVGKGIVEHYLEENVFAGLVARPDPERDVWFWSALAGSRGSAAEWSTKFELEDTQPADGEVKVHIFGAWGLDSIPQHVAVELNGVRVGSFESSALGHRVYTLRVPQGALRANSNQIKLVSSAEGAPGASGFYLDKIELRYLRDLVSSSGQLGFEATAEGLLGIELPASDSVHVFDRTTGVFVEPRLLAKDKRTRLTLTARLGHRYHVTSNVALEAPLSLRSVGGLNLQQDNVTATQIIVTVPQFMSAAQRLATYRNQQGVATAVVLIQDIYDSFAGGLTSPHALRAFFAQARPRWVLFVGGGSYDYRGEQGGDIPAKLVDTAYGLFASDTWYGNLDEMTSAVEVLVGRLPARTAQEADSMVERIMRYEALPDSAWYLDGMLVSGENLRGDFSLLSREVRSSLPPGGQYQTIDINKTTVDGAREELIAALGQGVRWLNYFGHGGIDRLDRQGLLARDQLGAISKFIETPALPIVTAMTCTVSRFEVPGELSWSESLLREGSGSAIAVWGPTGLTFANETMGLSARFAEKLAQRDRNDVRLGDILEEFYQSPEFERERQGTLRVFALLGDPALRVIQGAEKTAATASDSESGRLLGGGCHVSSTQGEGISHLIGLGLLALIVSRKRFTRC